ncbi:hypothetical protein pb186bvf_015766 [Paramecium bursaria]
MFNQMILQLTQSQLNLSISFINNDGYSQQIIKIYIIMNFIQIKGYKVDASEEGYIGQGQFGVVMKAYNEQNQMVCVKLMNIDAQDQVQLQREIDIVQSLAKKRHRNLVTIFDVQQLEMDKQQYQAVIMEYLDKGDLYKEMNKRIAEKSWFTFDQIVKIIRDIFCGQYELYNNKIIHRDLKPANILVGEDYKITDFGMCRVLDDMKKQQKLTRKGTPAYASPQIMSDQPFSAKADIYSLGIILYQLAFYGTYPGGSYIPNMSGIKALLQSLAAKQYIVPKIQLQAEPERQEHLRSLIQSMICFAENDRPDWDQLINHPLLIQVNQQLKPLKTVIIPTQTIILKSDAQLVLDSLFFDQKDPKYIDAKLFAQVSEEQFTELNSQNKIYHILKLFIAKSYVAESVCQQFEEVIKMPESSLRNYILAAINGYRANILINACGFSQGIIEMICPKIRGIYDVAKIEKALENFQSQEKFQDQKDFILELTQFTVSQFQAHANQAQFRLRQQYSQDLQNFYSIIQIREKASYTMYHRWFAYFYNQGLKNYSYNTPQEKKFKANLDYFLNLEASYPIKDYFKQNPNEIQDALDYINSRNY